MEIEQGTPEWHAQRRGRFTSSRFGDLMKNGRSKDSIGDTALSYILEITYEMVTGESVGFTGNAATEWGNEYEPIAIAHYEGVTGNVVDNVGFCAHPSESYAGGSPDGLIGSDGMLEIKCPYNGLNHAKNIIKGEFISTYQWQVQGNMWVTGRKWCDLVSFDPRFTGEKKIHIVRIDRDDSMIEQLEQRVKEASVLLRDYLEALGYSEELTF